MARTKRDSVAFSSRLWDVSRSGTRPDVRSSLRCRWSSTALLPPQDTSLSVRFVVP